MNEQQKSELVAYRYTKARETLAEIDTLLINELWNNAVNRIYYACFYAVSALLIDKEITVKTHKGTRQMFGLHFIQTGLIDAETGVFYSKVFNSRQKGDYDDFIDFNETEVRALIQPAEKLIVNIGHLLFKSA